MKQQIPQLASHPLDRVFPPNDAVKLTQDQADTLDDILTEVKKLNSSLAVIVKVLLTYTEANPIKKIEKKGKANVRS